MILFLNVFITDQRASPSAYKDLDPNSRVHSKLDVFKYTLVSYSVIKWTSAIFYLKIDNKFIQYKDELKCFINDLFPNIAKIYDYRLDSYEQWIEAIKLPDYSDETWIWFACNDDHPFIDSSLEKLGKVIEYAGRISSTNNQYVSIFPSHWQESMAERKRRVKIKNKPYHRLYRPSSTILEDNDLYYITTASSCISIQIITKKLLVLWFTDRDRCPKDLRRTDAIIAPKEQITLIPYIELVRHFDVYSHAHIPHEIVPPMFIPAGFFDRKMKVQYGGEKRELGYVYIHPDKKMISLEMSHRDRDSESNNLCDTNILYEELPLFWHDRISEVKKYVVSSDTTKLYIKQKIREVCADPKMGFTPLEAIYALKPVFYQKYNLKLKEMRAIAKSSWSFMEKISYNWRRLKFSHLITVRYSILTYTRLNYPWLWETIKKLIPT